MADARRHFRKCIWIVLSCLSRGAVCAAILCLTVLCAAILAGCVKERASSYATSVASSVAYDEYTVTMKQDLFCLFAGYPGYVTGIDIEGDNVYVVMESGRRILYDDRKEKSGGEKLDNPDLQDMFEQIYPLSLKDKLSDLSFDPGRIRVYGLLKEVYGSTKKEVEERLVNVPAFGGCFMFNGSNNAAAELGAVFRELYALGRENPAVYSYISPVSGTFNYRYISGTSRLSAHAFGIAADLAVNRNDYWKWATREQGQKRLSGYPMSVVDVFEKHGFIWGGKWGHFDIMHYEYRPEIILKSRYFSGELPRGESWYGDIARFDDSMKEYIDLIEQAFRQNTK